jgi:hypothetical protein
VGILALPVAAVIIPLAIRAGADPNGVIARLSRGEYGEQAMPIPDVIQAVREGSSEGWYTAASAAGVLAGGHVDAVGQASELLEDVGAGWQGDAAALALQRILRMIDVSKQASESYQDNADNLNGVAEEFDALKRSVESMPPRPPDKSLWDLVTPWQTDTEAAISEYNAKATENLEKYNSYASSVEGATQRLKLHYGHVEQFDADPLPPERGDRGFGSAPGHTVVATYGGGGGSGSGTPAWTPPGQAPVHSSPQGGIGVVPPVPVGTTPSAVPGRAPGHPAALTPQVGSGGSGPAGGSAGGPYASGPYASGPYAGGPHAGGGRGGTGGPPASGHRPGLDSRAGAGAPASAAPAGSGRTGGAVPPVGSSRPRSEGDDDGEHLDKLTTADDALFQLDRKAVDPSTGMRVMGSGSIGG